MTAVVNLTTFADLFQDATKDPFGVLANAAKCTAYKKNMPTLTWTAIQEY